MDRSVLEKIYGQLKVPFKYGAVLKLEGRMTDSPSVITLRPRLLSGLGSF